MSVIDASLFNRATLPSQGALAATRLLRELRSAPSPIRVPSLLLMEVASTLRRLEFRGVLTEEEANRALRRLHATPKLVVWDDRWADRAVEIARICGLSKTYDAIYLACAEHFDDILYTSDAAFYAALTPALAVRVRVVAP